MESDIIKCYATDGEEFECSVIKIIKIRNETDFYYWFFDMPMEEISKRQLGSGNNIWYKIFLHDMKAGFKWYKPTNKKGILVQYIDASEEN